MNNESLILIGQSEGMSLRDMSPMLILILSFLAGAVQMIAPDRWIPLSVLSWRSRWSDSNTIGFSSLTFGMHLLLGVALFFALENTLKLSQYGPFPLTLFAGSVILGGTAFRMKRFSRVRSILSAPFDSPSSTAWGGVTAIGLLGPSEVLIPVLAKTLQMGASPVSVILAFTMGTLIAGNLMVGLGRRAWDRPFWLPRVLEVVQRDTSALTVAVGLILGVGFLL